MELQQLKDKEIAQANLIYKQLGFWESDTQRDRTFGGFFEGQLVALGRLSLHAQENVHEIGGFWVSETARGRGLARQIVQALLTQWKQEQHDQPLFCVPFVHLVPFYQSFGLSQPAEGTPVPAVISAKISDCSVDPEHRASVLMLPS